MNYCDFHFLKLPEECLYLFQSIHCTFAHFILLSLPSLLARSRSLCLSSISTLSSCFIKDLPLTSTASTPLMYILVSSLLSVLSTGFNHKKVLHLTVTITSHFIPSPSLYTIIAFTIHLIYTTKTSQIIHHHFKS